MSRTAMGMATCTTSTQQPTVRPGASGVAVAATLTADWLLRTESSYCHPMDNLFRKIAHQFRTPPQVEEKPPTPVYRPQPRGASEALGRMYGATLPGGVTRANLIAVKNGEVPGAKPPPPQRVGGGFD